MTRHQSILLKDTQSFPLALVLFLFTSLATASGCVDLTQPWPKSGTDAGIRGNTPDSPGGLAPVDGGGTIGVDVAEAGKTAPELPVDAGQPKVDGPIEIPDDAQAAAPDAKDALVRLEDGGNLAADTPVAEADTAPSKEDGNPDINPDLRDSGPEDHPPDTIRPSPDTGRSLDAGPSLDTGRDGLELPGIQTYYPCESANGAQLPDMSLHGKNATLANGSTSTGTAPVGFSFGPGKVGNALTLSARDSAYLSLPKGIVAQLSEVTIATWVKINSDLAWQRIFDFGVDTNTFMYLATTSGTGVRFRIVSTPLNKNQVLEGAVGVPVGTWTHVALTLGNDGISIFFDGTRVAFVTPAALRPSDLGETANNFIGRSEFPENPYLDGQIDEFRIYNRVLSPVEIGELAGRP